MEWSTENPQNFSVNPYLQHGANGATSNSHLLYLPSQFSHELVQPGPSGISSSSSSSWVSPETVSPSSEDSENEPRGAARWSRAEVLLLISCYAERRDRFKDINTKNKSLWEEISEELQKKGVIFSAKVCETKMKNLKRSYVACVDHNKISGNDRKKCNYYEELHEIFAKDDAIQPKAVCSNLDGPVKRNKEAGSNAENSSSTGGSDAEEPPIEKKKKRKLPQRKKREEDLVGLFKDFAQDRKEEEKEKMKKLEDMHGERMAFMNRFLNVFEKSLDKDKS